MPKLKKYYIAESYRQFRDYCRLNRIAASDEQFICTDRDERLRGLTFHESQVVIIGNPRARFSFWTDLRQRVRPDVRQWIPPSFDNDDGQAGSASGARS